MFRLVDAIIPSMALLNSLAALPESWAAVAIPRRMKPPGEFVASSKGSRRAQSTCAFKGVGHDGQDLQRSSVMLAGPLWRGVGEKPGMNGIHITGGMHGLVPCAGGERTVFHHEWEGRARHPPRHAGADSWWLRNNIGKWTRQPISPG